MPTWFFSWVFAHCANGHTPFKCPDNCKARRLTAKEQYDRDHALVEPLEPSCD